MLVDPHTAVGIGAARARRRHDDVPMVCVSTAHPAKFPDAVEQATGVRPPLPERLHDLFDREERFDLLPPDLALVQAHVERSISARSEEHTSELQSLMRNSYAVFCLKKKNNTVTDA